MVKFERSRLTAQLGAPSTSRAHVVLCRARVRGNRSSLKTSAVWDVMATSGEEPLFDDFHRVSLSSSSPRRMDERRGHSREYLFSRNENSARGGGGGSVYEGDVGAREHGVGVASPSYGASAGPSRTPNSSSVKRSSSRQRVRYTAFLLDDLSRCSLLVWMREMGAESPGDWVTTCDHVTIHHSPSAAQLASFPFGVPCEMRVLGAAGDERSRAVHVDVPDFVPQPASAVRPLEGRRGEKTFIHLFHLFLFLLHP